MVQTQLHLCYVQASHEIVVSPYPPSPPCSSLRLSESHKIIIIILLLLQVYLNIPPLHQTGPKVERLFFTSILSVTTIIHGRRKRHFVFKIHAFCTSVVSNTPSRKVQESLGRDNHSIYTEVLGVVVDLSQSSNHYQGNRSETYYSSMIIIIKIERRLHEKKTYYTLSCILSTTLSLMSVEYSCKINSKLVSSARCCVLRVRDKQLSRR